MLMRDIIWGTEVGRTPIADIQRIVIEKLDSYSIYSTKAVATSAIDSEISAYRPVNLAESSASTIGTESASTAGSIA